MRTPAVRQRRGDGGAIRRLAERGHRRIGSSSDRAELYTAQERLRDTRDALSALGIAEDIALERANLANPASTDAAVRELFALPDPPTALFTGQNLITTAALHTLRALGLHTSIAVIGFDDFELSDLLDPPSAWSRRTSASSAAPRPNCCSRASTETRRRPASRRPDHADRARLRGDRAVILAAGEALIDLVVSFDGSIEAHPGGAPFNVCCTIARLERDAAFLGALSNDRFGTTLGRQARPRGRRPERRRSRHPPTTIALADLDETGAAHLPLLRRRHISVRGRRTAARAALQLAPTARTWAPSVSCSSRLRQPRRRSSTESTATCSSCSTRTAGPPSQPTAPRTSKPSPIARAERMSIKVSDQDLAFLALGGDAVQATRSLLRAGLSVSSPGRRSGHDRDRRRDHRRRGTTSHRDRHGRCG